MGKKNKKSFLKKQIKPFVKNHRVLLAALTGAATGIAIATILGTERAKQLVNTVEESVRDFTSKAKNELSKNSFNTADDLSLTKQTN